MLLSLLPGLRDLRTPLACGYIWILSIGLAATELGFSLDLKNPPRTEPILTLWLAGSAIGAGGILAALSFSAYLIGSFLEMRTDSRLAAFGSVRTGSKRVKRVFLPSDPGDEVTAADAIIQSAFSSQGLGDLLAYVEATSRLDPATSPLNDAQRIIAASAVLSEMPQLATRLLVHKAELYERYDRLMSEASFRLNVAPALLVLSNLAASAAIDSVANRIAVGVLSFIFCFALFRQGNVRAVSARDVIVQALTIDEVELNSRDIQNLINDGSLTKYASCRSRPAGQIAEISRQINLLMRQSRAADLIALTASATGVAASIAQLVSVDTKVIILGTTAVGTSVIFAWLARRRFR